MCDVMYDDDDVCVCVCMCVYVCMWCVYVSGNEQIIEAMQNFGFVPHYGSRYGPNPTKDIKTNGGDSKTNGVQKGVQNKNKNKRKKSKKNGVTKKIKASSSGTHACLSHTHTHTHLIHTHT